MLFRSTNNKFTHHQGDFLSNVDDGSSHGVHLTGGSTGGIVQPCGDEANIALNVVGKGTGSVLIGNSSSPVTFVGASTGIASTHINLNSTRVQLGTTGGIVQIAGSTAPFAGMVRYLDTGVATPNFATTNAMVMETTHTLSGVSSLSSGATGPFILANGLSLSTDCALVGCYVGSTADQVHCRFLKASTLAVGASTATIEFLVFRF